MSAVKKLQGVEVDGHKLKLKMSHKTSTPTSIERQVRFPLERTILTRDEGRNQRNITVVFRRLSMHESVAAVIESLLTLTSRARTGQVNQGGRKQALVAQRGV